MSSIFLVTLVTMCHHFFIRQYLYLVANSHTSLFCHWIYFGISYSLFTIMHSLYYCHLSLLVIRYQYLLTIPIVIVINTFFFFRLRLYELQQSATLVSIQLILNFINLRKHKLNTRSYYKEKKSVTQYNEKAIKYVALIWIDKYHYWILASY